MTAVVPLDPDSDTGRQVADDLTTALAEMRRGIAERAAQQADGDEAQAA